MHWRDLLAKALDGGRISYDEGMQLYGQAELDALAQTAHALRLRRVPGNRVTYLVDRNINYTNVCVTDCTFCGFYRVPGHAESYTLQTEKILRKIRETVAVGGTRILLQGGHNPGLRIGWYEDLLRAIKAEFPRIEMDAFSPSEIDHIAKLEGMTLRDVLKRLQTAGMDGLPGGGAEILDDEVRARIARKKQNTQGWLDAMREAHSLGMYTSATMVIGFDEELKHRMNHLERLRQLQDESAREHGNNFSAFISWSVQLENNALGRNRRRKGRLGANGVEYLRHAAFCRIYLDNFAHHQASWPTQGPEVAQMALYFGADDFGSTMLEENVVSSSGSKYSCMDRESIHHCIREAGFIPAQRDSRYHTLRVFDEAQLARR